MNNGTITIESGKHKAVIFVKQKQRTKQMQKLN